jgi:hypothetical protein
VRAAGCRAVAIAAVARTPRRLPDLAGTVRRPGVE